MKTLIKYLLKEDTVIFFDVDGVLALMNLEKIDTVSTMKSGIERWKTGRTCMQLLLLSGCFNSLFLKRV